MTFSSVLVLIALTRCWAETNEVRYTGSLSQESGGDQQVLRDFELVLIAGDRHFFSLLDDERSGCPWPESFGTLGRPNSPQPHLVYEYDGHTYSLPLPSLQIALPEDLKTGSKWTSGAWTFDVPDGQGSASTLQINGRERRGRRAQYSVDAVSGQLVRATQDVFMGQGDQFQMTVERTSVKPLEEDSAKAVWQAIDSLENLQGALGRRPDSQLSELSARQIEVAQTATADLKEKVADTPLQETVFRIRRNIAQQEKRISQTMKRRQQVVGQPAPKFALSLISGGTLESASLKGKTVVLHFWKYSDKPLSEPYGQVGYLEFLYGKRQQAGVEVVGVATNPALQQSEQLRSARRSARKLVEFMNLSYPIGFDNGSLLRDLGDPRESGGELPLWVVISPSGDVVHYQTGYYEIDRRVGLKELAEVLEQNKSE